MLKQGKKKLAKTAMKFMMNERVAKTFMTAIQKKNELNEKLARLYAVVQLPSLADHQSVQYAMDRMRRRIKGMEKEINQAQFALEKVGSAIDRMEIDTPAVKEDKPKKTGASKTDQLRAKDILSSNPIKKTKAKTAKPAKKAKPKAATKKPAQKSKKPPNKTTPNIKELGAASRRKPSSGGLLDLEFSKSGKRKKR